MKKQILLIGSLFLFQFSQSQDLPYARYILDSLCSPAMHGRGYVNSGEKIAAGFLINEFKKMNLVPLSENYSQPFSISVNTLPNDLTLELDDIKLQPGVDYLINPGSPSLKGKFKTVICREEDLADENRSTNIFKSAVNKFLVVEPSKKELTKEEKKKVRENIDFLTNSPDNPASGNLFLSRDKLTWDGSTKVLAKPTFTVKIDSVIPTVSNIQVNIESKFIKEYKTQNIIGLIKGTEKPDSFIVLTAHYDHLGRMGAQTYFPGANDNASGIAMLLNMAKYYKVNPLKYSVLFIAFGAEEMGLLGSKYYTENPLVPLSKIKFLINFDISGTGDEGIQVVNSSIFKKEFDRLTELNKQTSLLKEIKIRGTTCNSDHCMFYEKGVPCFFIYTLGGIKAYHDVFDKSETLPFTAFENYFKLMVAFIKTI